MATINKVLTEIRKQKPRNAWGNGVKKYAIELLDEVKGEMGGDYELTPSNYEKLILMGARDWKQFSYDAHSLIYNEDIAKRLLTKTELKKTKNGLLDPNPREGWLDVQARALYQASRLIRKAIVTVNASAIKRRA